MRLYFLIGILLTACNSNQSPVESSTKRMDEIRKMIEEDSFDVDTNRIKSSEDLNDFHKKQLTKMALKTLKPNYNLEDLSLENAELVYSNVLKTIEIYSDSSEDKQKYLDTIFRELELENAKLEENKDYPIELKLKIASIKSDIHFLHSNRQLKTKQKG